MIKHQMWEVHLGWSSGGSSYERRRQHAWPVGTHPMEIIREVASDPDNGCDMGACSYLSARRFGEPFEL